MPQQPGRRGFFRSLKLLTTGAIVAPIWRPWRTNAQETSALPAARGSLAKTPGGFVHPNKVLLWENTREEVREQLESGQLKAAILPTGSVEQHNEHMAMVADVAIATLISQKAALSLFPQVTVAPPSPCGYAPYHMARKGTMALRKETFLAYVLDVMSSLKAHGIHNIFILNGHGGNHQPLQEALPGWRDELEIQIEADSYWSGANREYTSQFMKAKEPTSHAGEFETSIYMAAFPERLRSFTMQEYDHARLNYESGFSPDVEEFLRRDGRSFKDGKIDVRGENVKDRRRQEEALLAQAETGEKILSKAIEFVVGRVRNMIAASAAADSGSC
jgi:creatinine amidohydrolase/Fe(II)-dependent formamide hydrolase-like protein